MQQFEVINYIVLYILLVFKKNDYYILKLKKRRDINIINNSSLRAKLHIHGTDSSL